VYDPLWVGVVHEGGFFLVEVKAKEIWETACSKIFLKKGMEQSPKDEEERKNGVRTIAPYGVVPGVATLGRVDRRKYSVTYPWNHSSHTNERKNDKIASEKECGQGHS
jgi:hypothetical protein